MSEDVNIKDDGKSNFDPDAFKKDLIEQNQRLLEQMVGSVRDVVAEVKGAKKDDVAINLDNDEDMNEFKNELEAIGISEEQGKGMLSMMNKYLQKSSRQFEEGLLTKVDERIVQKDDAKEATRQTLLRFPDIANKNSSLYLEAQRQFNKLSSAVKASPDGEQVAVLKAAAVLGIQPRDIKQSQAWNAQNPTGSGGEVVVKAKKEISADMAKLFGVDVKKVNEKLKEIKL